MLSAQDAGHAAAHIDTSSPPVLAARAVSVSFGGVHAVVDVDLEVGPGRLVGLIGPNGAGKTTFIDAITGFVRSRGRSSSTGGISPDCLRTHGHAADWRGHGNRSSSSTT